MAGVDVDSGRLTAYALCRNWDMDAIEQATKPASPEDVADTTCQALPSQGR